MCGGSPAVHHNAWMSEGLAHRLRSSYHEAATRVFLDVPGDGGWTYGQVDELAGRIAARLAGQGLGPGERVVVQVDKSVQAVALYLACLRTGATYVPLNPAYTRDEVAGFVADARPRLVVCHPERADEHRRVLTLAADGSGTLLAGGTGLPPLDPVAVDPEDIAAMLYTSGTTGRSKGAMLSHRALIANAEVLNVAWGIRADDVLVHVLPIFHTHGLFVALNTLMLSAASIRLLPRFDPATVAATLPGATVMMGVPTHYGRLLAAAAVDRSSTAGMRLFVSGSAPLGREASDRFHHVTGHRILERYGMTEAGMITSNPLEGDRIPGTVGFPLPGYTARVRKDSGEPAAMEEPGILEITGPHLFSGYWGMPGATAAAHTPDGYFRTGDVVTMDDAQRVTIVGRASDVVITGGLNVYPREVEDVLDGLPGVVESAVVGLPDVDLGEAVVAFVVAERGFSAETLRSAVREQLAGFKCPKEFIFIEELPRNAMGKIQKTKLRDAAP